MPLFLLIFVGAVVARAKLIDLAGGRALSAYVFWVAFPALLIHSLSHSPAPTAHMAASLGVYAAAMASPLIVILILGRVLRWTHEEKAGAGMGTICGNTAFLGAPLAVSLLGPAAAAPAAAVVAIDCTLIMVIATATLRSASKDGSWRRIASLTLTNPLVIAAAIGLAMSFAGVTAPGPIDQALATLRATASPVGLIALGIVMGLEFGRPAPGEAQPVLLAVLGKMVLAPILVWFATGLVAADPTFRATATLLAACPTAVNVFIQTRTLNVFAKGGAMVVVVATLVSVFTLPLLGGVLTH